MKNDEKKPCKWDRVQKLRVTRDGPCERPHCIVCHREHTTHDHPHTCPECIGRIRTDLDDIRQADTLLHLQAIYANGYADASSRIPGANAQVLVGPSVRLDMVRVSKHLRDDHRPGDPLPPLAVLAQWEAQWLVFLNHTPTGRRATLGKTIAYLQNQLAYMANHLDGAPDFLEFSKQVRALRDQAERALHDEREPERGVECFECGDRLVRRFRAPKRCRHKTPAKTALQAGLERAAAGRAHVRDVIGSYPELDGPTMAETAATRMPYPAALSRARAACPECTNQGGISNPTAGQSWECPGCRKEYTPGEYATAVRRDLIENGPADSRHGWCAMTVAAAAAADITGRPITAVTIRTWVERGDHVSVACHWQPGQRVGVQVVYWPDVLRRATETRRKGRNRAVS